MAGPLVVLGQRPCRSTFQPIQPQTGNAAVDDIVRRIQDEISRAMAQMAGCLNNAVQSASGGGSGGSGTPGSNGTNGGRGVRGYPGMPGEDGDDGETGPPGRDGITAQTYFDLFLSYGREDGASALMDRVGADPDFYLRPNTDKTVINQYEGSPGSTWEYEVTTALSGTLVLDLMVYYCGLTGFGGTPSLVASVTQNGSAILTSVNLDGATNSRIVLSLPGAAYAPGDRMGIRITTTNFSSGALMMTAHARCDEVVVAAGGPVGPAGPPGADGKDGSQGPPGIGVDSDVDWFPGIIPGQPGRDGINGRDGAPGANGSDGTDGQDGINGRDGSMGQQGIQGQPGPPGDTPEASPIEMIPPSPAAGGIGQLTGDVTAGPGVGALVATNVNAPDGFTHAGKIVTTAIVAPATPAAGLAAQYVDSTSKNICSKNDAGVINHGVQTRTAAASNWIRSVADDGTTSISQPAFGDISGTAALSQLGNGSALSVLGRSVNSAGNRADIPSTSGSDFALREHSGTIDWGTLATAALGANIVTYPKLQVTAAGKVLLGRDVGAGTVQEIGIDSSLAMTSGILGVVQAQQFTLTFGGNSPSIYSTLPAYLGIGDNAYSTSNGLGFRAPSSCSHQDWSCHVALNTLTGTGSLNVNLIKNLTTTIGTLFNYGFGVSGGMLQTAYAAAFSAFDLVGIQLAVTGGTITGGSLTIYVVGRFYT